jgi:hypothetical protein
MPFPCRFPAVPLPCRSFPFDFHSAAVFDSHIPWHGMCELALCVNQTRPHCVNQIGNTQSKTLAERHGSETAGEWPRNSRVTARERHGVCDSALRAWMTRLKVFTFCGCCFIPPKSFSPQISNTNCVDINIINCVNKLFRSLWFNRASCSTVCKKTNKRSRK